MKWLNGIFQVFKLSYGRKYTLFSLYFNDSFYICIFTLNISGQTIKKKYEWMNYLNFAVRYDVIF